jgi:hypothetical protein
MSAFCRPIIVWTLAAWFAVLVAVDEGWHFVPGNAHWVELPNGHGLVVGMAARSDADHRPDGGSAVTTGRPDGLPLKDADACVICRLSGQAKLPRLALDDPCLEPFQQPVAVAARPLSCLCVSSPFHARAPPLV